MAFYSNRKAYITTAALLAAVLMFSLIGCEKTEGDPIDFSELNFQTCTARSQCGQGRFCKIEDGDESGICTAECGGSGSTRFRDCFFKDEKAFAVWQKAEDNNIPYDCLNMDLATCEACVDNDIVPRSCWDIPISYCRECSNYDIPQECIDWQENRNGQLRPPESCYDFARSNGMPALCIDGYVDYTLCTECLARIDQGQLPDKCTDGTLATSQCVECVDNAKKAKIPLTELQMPEPSYYCTECGTCWSRDAEEEDPLCSLGEGQEITSCNNDQECENALGRHHACIDNVCVKDCLSDEFCKYHGWKYECKLPDGVDQTENFYTVDGTVGVCEEREGGIDWGSNVDENIETAKLVGVYGAIHDTAVTNCGLPLVGCQDTASIQHLLYKISQTADGILLEAKYCNMQLKNIRPQEEDPDKDDVSEFDDISWMEVPASYSNSVILLYNPSAIDSSAEVNEGFEFMTERHIEVRGAWPNATPEETVMVTEGGKTMPTYENPEGAWDQDRDGKDGMTTIMNGVLQGEIYNVQRWFIFHRARVAKLKDGKVDKLWGQFYHWSEQYVVGASKQNLVQDLSTQVHSNRKRSFFRMIRLDDDATCDDVLAIGLSETNCNSNQNLVEIDPDNDDTWLCYTPTVDPQGKSTNPWRVTDWPSNPNDPNDPNTNWPAQWETVDDWDTEYEQ